MKQETSPFILDHPRCIESGWDEALKDEWEKPYIKDLCSFLKREYTLNPGTVYPPEELIFNAFNQTPYNKTRVVIVGQDPYHGPGQAHGLSFSVPPGTPPPPSLKNIFKELSVDLKCPLRQQGCLTDWANQGVLLLNATLTVNQGAPLSHHNRGWESFTDAVICKLAERKEAIIFVLWGQSASHKCGILLDPRFKETTHIVLKTSHPSPLSARRGFFGCRHFSQINEILIQSGSPPINWT